MSRYNFLHDFQKRASDFWLKHKQAYFAVDMGLGKTAIVLYSLTRIKRPALVVAPLRTIFTTWPEEINKWDFPLEFAIVHGEGKEEALRVRADVYLTNYETIPWIYSELRKIFKQGGRAPFEVLVIDEGSKIKNPKTKRFKFFDALKKIFSYRAILSGTPAPNTLLDLWSQYYILTDGRALGDHFYSYRNRYFTQHAFNPYSIELKENADIEIYNRIRPSTFRLAAEDYLELPEITYNYIALDLPKGLRKTYNTFKKDFLVTIGGVDLVALNSATLSNKLRQFLQGFNYYETGEFDNRDRPIKSATEFHDIKVHALKDLVEDLNQPVLCAIQFKHELEMIRRVFPKAPIIAGGTSTADATKFIKLWNNQELPLLLCHPLSLSHGVNLQTGGSNILWYCQPWSLEQYLQFNSRLHRQGQRQGVVINHLTIKDSIDDKVAQVLSDKNLTQQKLLDFLKDEENF